MRPLINRLRSALKAHDWIADGLLCMIPLWLLWACVVGVFSLANDYLNPPPVKRAFASAFVIPYVVMHLGFLPVYHPYSKWTCSTQGGT